MFLVVLSSDIKASWNWCQKPQALKNAGTESRFIFQTKLKVGIWILYYFSDIFPTSNSKTMTTTRRTVSSSLLFSTNWSNVHTVTPLGKVSTSFHILGKKVSYANRQAKCFHKRLETAPGPCYRSGRGQLSPQQELQANSEHRQHMSRATFSRKVHPKDLEKQRQEDTAAKGQTELLQTPEPKGWATDVSSLDRGKEEETPNARQTEASCKWASGRQDLLIFLHTAIQYSSDSKLFLLPPQPPYIKRMHFLLLGSKYQRGITARQGPVIASWEQTAVWRRVRIWASEEHRLCRATYTTQWWL